MTATNPRFPSVPVPGPETGDPAPEVLDARVMAWREQVARLRAERDDGFSEPRAPVSPDAIDSLEPLDAIDPAELQVGDVLYVTTGNTHYKLKVQPFEGDHRILTLRCLKATPVRLEDPTKPPSFLRQDIIVLGRIPLGRSLVGFYGPRAKHIATSPIASIRRRRTEG